MVTIKRKFCRDQEFLLPLTGLDPTSDQLEKNKESVKLLGAGLQRTGNKSY